MQIFFFLAAVDNSIIEEPYHTFTAFEGLVDFSLKHALWHFKTKGHPKESVKAKWWVEDGLYSSALHLTQHFKLYIRHRHLAPHRLGRLSCRVRVKWWSLGKVLLGSFGSKLSACHSVFCGTSSCWSMKWVRLVSWLNNYTLYTVIPFPCLISSHRLSKTRCWEWKKKGTELSTAIWFWAWHFLTLLRQSGNLCIWVQAFNEGVSPLGLTRESMVNSGILQGLLNSSPQFRLGSQAVGKPTRAGHTASVGSGRRLLATDFQQRNTRVI